MRIESRAARAFTIALFAAIVVAALLLWVSGTEPALRWIAAQIVEQTQGKLALEPVFASHGARVDESIEICRQLWSDPVVTHTGLHY